MSTITPNMNIEIPDVLVTDGPDWATLINAAFSSAIDNHDHSSGKGVKVTPAGMDITNDLAFGGYKITNIKAITLSGVVATDFRAVYATTAGELAYKDSAGNVIQITSGGSLNAASIGGIGGDYAISTAAVVFTNLTDTFTFTQDTNHPAVMDQGPTTIRRNAVGGKGVNLYPNAAIAADYNLEFPAALPLAGTALLEINNVGQLSLNTTVEADLITAQTDITNLQTDTTNLQTDLAQAQVYVVVGTGATGSKGDYEGTNQTPFVNAIAAINALGGGTIFVKKGTYTFTSKLTISNNNIRIIGEHNNATKIVGSIASSGIIEITGNNVILENLYVEQQEAASENYAVYINYGSVKSAIKNCMLVHSAAGNNINSDFSVVYCRGSHCHIANNIVLFGNMTANACDRTGIKIGTLATLGTEEVKYNIISNNIILITNNGGSGTEGSGISIKSMAINLASSRVEYNVIAGNVSSVGGYGVFDVVRCGIDLLAYTAGAGATATLNYNAIQTNTVQNATYLIRANSTGPGVELLSYNCIMGNVGNVTADYMESLGAVGTTLNSNYAASSVNYLSSSAFAYVGNQVIDKHFNQIV